MKSSDKASQADQSAQTLRTILDSLDALVYVADMDSYELLYMNAYGRHVWGLPAGRRCWEVIQAGQTSPCAFCTNQKLIDAKGRPANPYVWEFQNTANNRWYQCHDQAIPWTDGRLVRLEIATDITERKEMEEALKAATQQARELALTDDLTGMNNRRAFFCLGHQRLRTAERAGRPVSLVMLDADHFKHINDNYGHTAGDETLKAIADTILRLSRDADVHGRLGGEEFAVLLEDCDLSAATRLAERLRAAIDALVVPTAAGPINCTASLGIADSNTAGWSLERLISSADQAMYRAKRGGRNRIEHAT